MTTRKQAARDKKRRTHGWESEALPGPEPVEEPRSSRKPAASKSSGKAPTGPRGQRIYRDGDVIVNGRQRIQPPTWRRTLIRTAIFLPVMFVIVHFLFRSAKMTLSDEALLIAMYAVVTIGVMHFSETLRYNRLDKKLTEAGSPRRSAKR